MSPVAPLHKALYGHPESSAHWAKHVHAILLELGSRESSVYYFEREGLILCVYVEDLTLAGRIEVHPAFWNRLSQRLELGPFAPLTRVLASLPYLWILPTAPDNASSCAFPSPGVMSNLHLLLLIWMKARCLSVIVSRVDSMRLQQHHHETLTAGATCSS